MVQKPLISILMPVFNAEKFLDDCVDSIVKQVFTNWELIIVNDHSTDGSNLILNEWSRKDQRIRVLQNTSKGIIPALALAFENSCGDFITRMDADDLMPKEKLQSFSEQAALYPNAVITGKVSYFSEESVSKGYKRYESWLNSLIGKVEHWQSVYRECVIASPNWMVKRDCFEKDIVFTDLVYPEDYDMVLKWYEKGYTIASILAVTHLWREHPERTSRNSENYQQKAFFKLKTKRFVKLEIEDPKVEKIQLIGAGVKGKLVAKELDKQKINYDWFDFKASGKGIDMNGVTIQALQDLKPQFKTILTVWPEDDLLKKEVESFLQNKQLVFGDNCWLF